MRWALPSVVALTIVASCTPSRDKLPQLPMGMPSLATKPPPKDSKGLKYRKTGGEAISPVIVTDEAAPTVAPTVAAATAGGSGTLNGHPGGITRETLNRSIQGSMSSLAACFSNLTSDPMVAVSFEAEPSGKPSLVRIKGAPPDAERCIRNVVQSIRFPGFEGKGVQVDLPLSFHRVLRPSQPAGAAQQGQENAPPLFLEP